MIGLRIYIIPAKDALRIDIASFFGGVGLKGL